ncbi:MAG: glycosyltransferase [Isosphaeraceae bacterium]
MTIAKPNSSWGGAQKYLKTLIGKLLENGFGVDAAIDRRADVTDLERWFADQGVGVHHLPLIGGGDLSIFLEMRKLLRHRGYGAVHFNGFPRTMAPAILAARMARIGRRVMTLHLPVAEDPDAYHREQLLRWYWREHRRNRFCLATLTDIICINESLREELVKPLRQDPGKIHRIYNGIDLPAYRRRAEPGQGQPLTIGAIGLLSEVKRLDILLHAVSLIDRRSPIRLLIAGAGALEPDLRRLIGDLGLEGRAELVGYQSSIQDFLSRLDVFAMSSDSEGIPYALLEAMASGLPSVVTGVGGIPEMVEDQVEALVVCKGDPRAFAAALERLIADGALRAALGERARRRAESQFSLQSMLDQTLAVFRAPRPMASGS